MPVTPLTRLSARALVAARPLRAFVTARPLRPTAAFAAAAVFFTAGISAGAIHHQLRVDQAVAHARDVAARVEASRASLETSLARAESATSVATAVAAAPPVALASRALSTSADAASRAAEQHRVNVTDRRVVTTVPVPLAADGSTPLPPASVLGAGTSVGVPVPAATVSPDPIDQPAPAAPQPIADVEVRRVLDGDAASVATVQDAVVRLEAAAADLDQASLALDRSTERLEAAAAEAVLERATATLDRRIAAATTAVAGARESVSAVGDMVNDTAPLIAVEAAARTVERLAAQPIDRVDPAAVDLRNTALATAGRALGSAEESLRTSHAAWVESENVARESENQLRRDAHAAALAAAEADRTAAYRAAVAARQEGWSGTPAGITYRNGRLPQSALCPLPFAPAELLTCDAVRSLSAADAAYHAETGRHLVVESSYRAYSAQVQTKAVRSRLAAAPGTSNHGWGMAVDLDSASAAWLRARGADYGWVHPTWARPGGTKPESWHLEYVAPGIGHLAVAPLELLEPAVDVLAS